MKQMKKWSWLKPLWPIALFFVVTFGIFMPSSLFLGNIDEFSIDYIQVFPIIFLCSLISLMVIFLLGFVLHHLEKVYEVYLDLLCGITLGFYVQGNFMNGTLPELNGRVIDWDNGSGKAIASAVVWLLLISMPVIIGLIKPKLIAVVRGYGSCFLSAIQIVTLIVLIVSTTRAVSNEMVVTKRNEFELAKKNNVVVFVIDTLDAAWAEEIINSDEHYSQIVRDFEFFDNVVAGGAPTILGMPLLLTGQTFEYPYEMFLDDYYKKAYGSSDFFQDLKQEGYDVHLYTSPSVLNYADIENIDNISPGEYEIDKKSGFAKYLYKLTSFYAMPYHLKHLFVLYSGDFAEYVSAKETEQYKFDDPLFYEELSNQGVKLGSEDSLFVLYHLYGAHGPYTMNEKCESVPEEQTNVEQQIQGNFVILQKYFGEMKRLGIYDDSTIIITADHGGEAIYQNPAVYIKMPNMKGDGEIKVNSAPATFENLHATFASACLSDASKYGKTMFDDLSDNLVNGRVHTTDGNLRVHDYLDSITGYEYDRYRILGSAKDVSLIQDDVVFSVEFAPYKFDTDILFARSAWSDGAGKYIKKGFSTPEEDYTWTLGKQAFLQLKVDEVDCDIEMTMEYQTFHGNQRVQIYVNDEFVSEYVARDEGTITHVIPKEVLGDGDVVLRLELPDAHSPKSVGVSDDSRELALSMKRLRFSKKK